MHICILQGKFEIVVCISDWMANSMGKALDLRIRGREFESSLLARFFHSVILGFRSLQAALARVNEISSSIHLDYTLF